MTLPNLTQHDVDRGSIDPTWIGAH